MSFQNCLLLNQAKLRKRERLKERAAKHRCWNDGAVGKRAAGTDNSQQQVCGIASRSHIGAASEQTHARAGCWSGWGTRRCGAFAEQPPQSHCPAAGRVTSASVGGYSRWCASIGCPRRGTALVQLIRVSCISICQRTAVCPAVLREAFDSQPGTSGSSGWLAALVACVER